jgi:hypothetical protein
VTQVSEARRARASYVVAPSDPRDAKPAAEESGFAAPEVAKARQHLVTLERSERVEVLVVPGDEENWAGRRRPQGEPAREFAGALVGASGAVHALGVRPDPEVADVQDVVEGLPQRSLEGEDVRKEAMSAKDVARGAVEGARFIRVIGPRKAATEGIYHRPATGADPGLEGVCLNSGEGPLADRSHSIAALRIKRGLGSADLNSLGTRLIFAR